MSAFTLRVCDAVTFQYHTNGSISLVLLLIYAFLDDNSTCINTNNCSAKHLNYFFIIITNDNMWSSIFFRQNDIMQQIIHYNLQYIPSQDFRITAKITCLLGFILNVLRTLVIELEFELE